MATSILDMTPFTPSDQALVKSSLPDRAITLINRSAKLAGQLQPKTLETIRRHMQIINSYYSNLIEGNSTRPHEIRAAQRGDYSTDPAKRDLQLESLAHMAVQDWIHAKSLSPDQLFTPEFIRQIHHEFYSRVPQSLWAIKNEAGDVFDTLTPGEWRRRDVRVGEHVACPTEDIEPLMRQFCETYHPKRYRGDRKLIAMMAAHHRLLWIHPFIDGNGRVARLFTDAALKAAGLDSCGAWCLSRGLARSSKTYKQRLAGADQPRQGDRDGRGQLTEKGLIALCEYLLDTAIDQVEYMSKLLNFDGMRQRIESYVQARNDGRVLGMSKIKPASSRILYAAFLQGEIDRAQAMELLGMSERTGRRLLSQLKEDWLLSETSSRSPLQWEIPEHVENWYFPELIHG